MTPDPIGLWGGINLFAYVNNPVNFADPYGLTWGESLSMLWEWISGTGPDDRTFGAGSNQVWDMINAPGVNRARGAFYRKNAYNLACEKPLKSLTNYNPGYGLRGFWNAGLNSTQQFVGNYRVDIIPNDDGTITFYLTNTTSVTSLLYGNGPEWDRSTFRPGGNMSQTYTWTEGVPRIKFKKTMRSL